MEWMEVFRQHILDRGAEYYEDGHVTDFKLENGMITATVEGTEPYEVAIEAEGEHILDMHCDCPYAESGNNCKHMAAVLFRYEEMLAENDMEKNTVTKPSDRISGLKDNIDRQKREVRELVAKIPEEDVRKMLERFIMADNALKNSLQLRYDLRMDAKQMTALKEEINTIVWQHSGRDRFVDWRHASDFCYELRNFLEKKVSVLAERGYRRQAFELTNRIFFIIGTVDMDDSDGGSGLVASDCCDMWEKIYKAGTAKERKDMQGWFENYREGQLVDWIEEYLYDFMEEQFVTESDIMQHIRELDEIIQEHENDNDCGYLYSSRFGMQNVILKRIEYMKKLGKPKQEIREYLSGHRNFYIVREMEVDEALAAGDIPKAIAILKESKERDAGNKDQISKYSKKLIKLYQKTLDTENVKKELLFYIFKCRQTDLTYFRELKRMITDEKEWQTIVDKIVRTVNNPYFVCDVLFEEAKYEDLMDQIFKEQNIILMDEYWKQMKRYLPEKVILFYQQYVCGEIQKAGDRKRYRTLVRYLKKIRDCKGGKEEAEKIADQWKMQYKRRPALMDELRRERF